MTARRPSVGKRTVSAGRSGQGCCRRRAGVAAVVGPGICQPQGRVLPSVERELLLRQAEAHEAAGEDVADFDEVMGHLLPTLWVSRHGRGFRWPAPSQH